MAAVKPVGPLLVQHAGASHAASPETDAGAGLSPEEIARRGHYFMALQREVEDRIERKLYRQGKILGQA